MRALDRAHVLGECPRFGGDAEVYRSLHLARGMDANQTAATFPLFDVPAHQGNTVNETSSAA